MILGMPVTSWLLLAAAVGIGLALELAFYMARRRDPRRRDPGQTQSRADQRGDQRGEDPR